MAGDEQRWQCVLVAWGDKYPVAEINRLVASVASQSRGLVRTVLLTDRDRPGLDEGIEQRRIPEWWLAPEFRAGGCQAKLSQFEEGLLPDDVPAIFLDLDTMVLGDLSRLLTVMKGPETVAILQSAVLPFGPVGRMLYRLTGGRRYARGNSSVIVFHPAHCPRIAAKFRALYAQHGGMHFRPMIADERFISWAAQPVMQAVPTRLVVKFPTEYMQPWRWMVALRAALPWVKARRRGLLAVTFPGVKLKGEDLAALPEGATFTDPKGRKLFWADWALGGLRQRIIRHYQPANGHGQTP
jgi:hypothetical protein